MQRQVMPEVLDDLPTSDPAAAHSRRDLVRLNRLMGHDRHLATLLRQQFGPANLTAGRALSVTELGAGDGTFILRAAERAGPLASPVLCHLVDRAKIVTRETVSGLVKLGWETAIVTEDVFDWLDRKEARQQDFLFANLFLHHFEQEQLVRLLGRAAAQTRFFAAIEPRRAYPALLASRVLGLIGCNRVTRHDAVVSVRAGFRQREISSLWPPGPGWKLVEQPVGLFSHLFTAERWSASTDSGRFGTLSGKSV